MHAKAPAKIALATTRYQDAMYLALVIRKMKCKRQDYLIEGVCSTNILIRWSIFPGVKNAPDCSILSSLWECRFSPCYVISI